MPWRLIGFILLFAVFLIFIGFNLENSCNISFGFVHFDNVPVYLTAFSSFIFGMLCALPLAISFRLKKKSKGPDGKDSGNGSIEGPKPEQKKWGKKDKEIVTDINQGNYGID